VILADAILEADYNTRPISYAQEAFYLNPGCTTEAAIAWRTKSVLNKSQIRNISIKADTQMVVIHPHK